MQHSVESVFELNKFRYLKEVKKKKSPLKNVEIIISMQLLNYLLVLVA